MKLKDNLTAYWSFDETSGDALDSLGVNNLTNSGVAYASGKINNCADIQVYPTQGFTNNTLHLTGTMTLSFWLNFPENTYEFQQENIMRSNASGYLDGFTIYLTRYYNTITFSSSPDGFTSNATYFTLPDLPPYIWYNFVITYDSTKPEVRLYINGVEQLVLVGFTLSSNLFDDPTSIIYVGDNCTEQLDEFGLWSRVLTSQEILRLYNSGSGLSYDNLNEIWFDSSKGSTSWNGGNKTTNSFTNDSKNSTSFTNLIKKTTTFSNDSKSTTSYSNVTINPATFSNTAKTTNSFSNQAKTTSSFSNLSKIPNSFSSLSKNTSAWSNSSKS